MYIFLNNNRRTGSNKSYDFHIPNNIDDFNKLSSKKNSTSKISSIFKAKSYPIYLKEPQKMANDYKIESMRKRMKKFHINDNGTIKQLFKFLK
ncbi:hypothetical protein RhiirB3_451262 [Rhizophagus irregularis]|nr:hypothetical protein RhiirB3_451262 [Rhizophagus irregularis]